MFVPRQVQKKPIPPKQPAPALVPALITAPKSNAYLAPPSPAPPNRTEAELSVNETDIVAAREIVMALEILMSDYSLGRVYGNWLVERMRELEGKNDYIHLSTFVGCQYLSGIRPRLSQVSLMKAFIVHKSDVLELSTDKYHVRRKTNILPSRKGDQDNFAIYIEPNITNIVLNPGKIARILSEAQLPQRYFPVQFVDNAEKSWSFVILSSEISEVDATNKNLWPADWIVLTKSEWRRRDTEYQELRKTLLRVPTSHHLDLPHETMQREGDIHPRLENTNPCEQRATGPNGIVPWGEALPYHGNSGNPGFETGLIVRLTNLHPLTTKATINSFVCRSVGRYLRKKAKKQERKKDGVVPDNGPQSVKIYYVDYEKGLSQAYIRQSSQKDSVLVVHALKRQKRRMRDGEDIKGKKAVKADEQDWVVGKILIGEEERVYWDKILLAKNSKGKGRDKNGRKDGRPVVSDFGAGTKRTRQSSENPSSQVPKRIRFDQ